MKESLSTLVIGVVGAVVLCGCSSAPGSVQGHVLIFSPVPHPGSTTTLPVAHFPTQVEAKAQGRVVATQGVPPGKEFHLALPPGAYTFDVVGVYNCVARATVRSGEIANTDVRCVEP
jgi:hypothetical protein